MASTTFLRLAVLGILSLTCFQNAEGAELSLAEAVAKADGKYLDVPEVGHGGETPQTVVGGGEESAGPSETENAQVPLKVTLTYVEEQPQEEETPDADADLDETPLGESGEAAGPLRAPVVTVYFDGPAAPTSGDGGETTPAGSKVVAKLESDSAGFADPPVSVQIAELDPRNPYPEVVVSFFTGGAHCCSVTSVVTSNKDGSEWKTVDVGEFDGGPLLSVDLDGDGRYEFETRDNAFLYAFGCYACSEAPLQVLALEDGKIEDVNADPRFKPAHAAWLKTMIVGVPDADVNGFLAGYVGEKIRLGEGKEAWALMLDYYDKDSDMGLETCDQPLNDDGECPGETVMLSFPDALERMLKENGYKVEK
ncbi:MAG: hypothetical protein ACREDO_09095 [Methyloceanibacter sp.]